MNNIRLTTEDVSIICRALSHLLQAGIAPGDGLTLLARDETQPAWRDLFDTMARGCDEGKPLPAVFREAGCFPGYVCALLDVGHRVGQSAEVLEALADYYENRAGMNRRLRNALTYPGLLLAVLLAVVAVLFIWVLPVFDDVYAQLGSGLTGIAGGLLAFGQILRRCLPWLCAFLAAVLCAAAIPGVRRAAFRFWADRWGHRGAMAKVNAARFVQALSLGLDSGLSELEAAELAAGLAGESKIFAKSCRQVLSLLETGTALHQALLQTHMLRPGDCRLLEVSYRSGHSDRAIRAIACRIQEEAEAALEQAVGRIEPAIIAVACTLIGGVLLTVMLPLVQIMNTIG